MLYNTGIINEAKGAITMATTTNKKHNDLALIKFSMMWNQIIKNGKRHPDGGYVYRGVRTMITPGNNRKLYNTISHISFVEIGKTIRIYGLDKSHNP